jgi:hypothetical protein
MTNIIFLVGFLVTLAVCYALFAYTIGEMKSNDKTGNTNSE